MFKEIRLNCEIAVVGAGPAGIAAATVAAQGGRSVILLDDNTHSGGQIWRGENAHSKRSTATEWLQRLDRTSAQQLFRAIVFHANDRTLFAESPEHVFQVSFEKLILATGARERFLCFPGWTLPGVFGAGGLQALIKSGLPMNGKRIVIAGTGPLLLAVAAFAKEKGAQIVCIAEQTSWTRFARFGLFALLSTHKSRAAIGLLWKLRGIPHWKSAWPVAAVGDKIIRAVRISRRGKTTEITCDYLACGFHLVPSLELAQSLGCQLQEGFVSVDHNQRTSCAGIYCAGETTGIGGFERSLLQGQIAGYSAAGLPELASALHERLTSTARDMRLLHKVFALRGELRSMPEHDTLVCRCEDVSFGKLLGFKSWREAKLQTRCGMGPCQGRVCGPATEFLFGWNVYSARPPIFPVQCSSLASISTENIRQQIRQGGSQ